MQKLHKLSAVELRNVPIQTKIESKSKLINIVQNTLKVLDVDLQETDVSDVYRIKDKKGSYTIVTNLAKWSFMLKETESSC